MKNPITQVRRRDTVNGLPVIDHDVYLAKTSAQKIVDCLEGVAE